MLNSVEECLDYLKRGKVIIVVDDDDREAEGDFICASEFATPDVINFMATEGRGLICTSMTAERIEELHLPLMVQRNTSQFETAFTISVDAVKDVTTGISASDRSITSILLADPKVGPEAFVTPGHSFPLKAQKGGVLVRAGHTEAAVDLSRLAGLQPSGVICEIMNADGTMARMPRLKEMSKELDMPILAIEDLIAYRRLKETLVHRVSENLVDVPQGKFHMFTYREEHTGTEHVALMHPECDISAEVVVRVHNECFQGDVLKTQPCDSRMTVGLQKVAEEKGVFVYLRHAEPGVFRCDQCKLGPEDKMQSGPRARKQQGSYGIGAQILSDLGLGKISILSKNEQKISGMGAYGLEIVSATSWPAAK